MATEFAPDADAGVGPPSLAVLASRRLIFAALVATTTVTMGTLFALILAHPGVGILDCLLIALFTLSLPCLAIGMWNSLIGFVVLHGASDPLALVIPPAARACDDDPIVTRTAIAITMRNENPVRPFASLAAMRRDLDASGYGEHFDFFVLSDSTAPEVFAAEERQAAAFRETFGEDRLVYRRRASNVGYKGGNIHDFCERFGNTYMFLVPLDIDSLMTAARLVRLVRIMQKNPQLGILQSLACGLPTESLFARVFGFGHRLSMLCFVYGADWWQGDCCQFWGHNAAIRLEPFTTQCRLPVLSGEAPFGGHIICHDQIEAAFMRRAGFEVRFLPEQSGSYEGNPPSAPDFVKRNTRWCRGNLQNLRLIGSPGLTATSRFHLAYMAGKFFTAVVVVIFVVLAALAVAVRPFEDPFPATAAIALFAAWFAVYLMPRFIGILDAIIRQSGSNGGTGRLIGGAIAEIVFTVLLTPISMFEAACATLAFLSGESVGWESQHRDGYRMPWRQVVGAMWRPTLFGVALVAFLAIAAPTAIVWFAPFLTGLVLAVPFTVATSSATLGALAQRWRLCPALDEFDTPPAVAEILPLLLHRISGR
jgi:membrane glycosyltransferase